MKKKPIVDIVATASPASKKEIQHGEAFLKHLGCQPRLCGVFRSSSLFAQNESSCFKNLKKALLSADSQAVWSLRGGYGSQRLLPYLDQIKAAPKRRKVFIGLSDATVLHDWIHHHWRQPTLHFSVLSKMQQTSANSKKMFQQLFLGAAKYQKFSRLKLIHSPRSLEKKKKIISSVTGGNLTMIQSSIGTPWNFSRKNKILFLEDVNEKPYQIHRALWQMRQSGVFQGVRALIFGKWEKAIDKEVKTQVLAPFARQCAFPVFLDLPCGHHAENLPLPLGAKAELAVEKDRGFLKVSSPF